MYAWRARIGLVKPTHRGKSFAYWYKRAPEGVEIVPTFIGFRKSDHKSFAEGFGRAEQIAAELKESGCDIIVVSGTPPFLLQGLDFEREWGRNLSEKLGLPVVTPMEPHALALQALGIRRVAVATYYGDELNRAILKYFARFDIEGVLLGGLSATGEGADLYTTSLRALDEVSHEQVYRYCKSRVQQIDKRVDGVYINGGGWDAPPAIEALERDLNTKVVFTLAADMWLTFKKLSIDFRVDGSGALLRENPEAP